MDLIFDFSGENLSLVIFVYPGLNFQNAGLHIITLLHTLTHFNTRENTLTQFNTLLYTLAR